MKRNKYLFLAAGILLLGISPLQGAAKEDSEIRTPSWRELSARAETEKFPDADSVLLLDNQKVVFHEDGTSEETDDFYQKMLTEKGCRRFHRIPLYFHAAYGTAEFQKAEIFRPGASEAVAIDLDRNVSLTADSSSMDSNIYDPDEKILQLNVPELHPGDVLHLVTREVTRKPRIPGVWCGIYPLQSTDPVLHYAVTVRAPASMPLQAKAVKNPAGEAVLYREVRSGKYIEYRWIARDVPQVFPEPEMPAVYTCAQRLVLSTAPDWRFISRWYYRLCRPRMDAVSPEMKAKVEELTRNITDVQEKMRRIFRFVSQEIRYMGITTEKEAPGYEPHDVSMTFAKRYGVCRDKAALLVSMLELAGIRAYPVLMMVGDPKDPDVPNNYFNHAVTAAELIPGEYILMDPTYENTAEFLPAGDRERSYLVARPDGEILRTSPPGDPGKNRLSIQMDAKASADGGMTWRCVLNFGGVYDMIYRSALAGSPADFRRQLFAGYMKRSLPGAVLETVQITPEQIRDAGTPLQICLTGSGTWHSPFAIKGILMPVPSFAETFGALTAGVLRAAELEKRRYPMKFYTNSLLETSFSVQFPEGVEPESMPKTLLKLQSPVMETERQTMFENRVLTQNFKMRILKTRISPEDYAAWKKMLKNWEKASRENCILRIDGAIADDGGAFPGADAVLTRSEEWHLSSLSAGSLERKYRVHVLNYAGVKRYSEIQIPYNPVWDGVPEVTGCVKSAEGKILHRLSPAEINVMDQPWTGSAPRYPAGKILAVSFPGVQPGCVLEYSVKQNFRDRPMIAVRHVFAGYEPMLSDTFQVHLAPGTELKTLPEPPFLRQENGAFLRRNIPGIPREPEQPDLGDFATVWGFTTGDWKTYAASLLQVLKSRASNQPKAAARAAELCKNCSGDEAKIRAVRDDVLRNIRLAGPSFTELPFTVLSPADKVLEDGYGNSADRAILLHAMLTAAGIPARFAAVESGRQYTQKKMHQRESFPDGRSFPEIMVLAGEGTWPELLGGGSEYDAMGTSPWENCMALDLEDGHFFVPEARNPDRRKEEHFNITLREDGTGRMLWTKRYYGSSFGVAAREFAEQTPEKRKRYAQSLLTLAAQNARALKPLETKFDRYPGIRSLEMDVEGLCGGRGRIRQMELPCFGEVPQAVRTWDSRRRTPLERCRALRLELKYRIAFPEGWRVLPEKDFEMDTQQERVTVRRKVLDQVLYVNISIELYPCQIRVQDYDDLERLQAELSAKSLRTVVFEVLKKP